MSLSWFQWSHCDGGQLFDRVFDLSEEWMPSHGFDHFVIQEVNQLWRRSPNLKAASL